MTFVQGQLPVGATTRYQSKARCTQFTYAHETSMIFNHHPLITVHLSINNHNHTISHAITTWYFYLSIWNISLPSWGLLPLSFFRSWSVELVRNRSGFSHPLGVDLGWWDWWAVCTWKIGRLTPRKGKEKVFQTSIFRGYVSFREGYYESLENWWLVQRIHFLLNWSLSRGCVNFFWG